MIINGPEKIDVKIVFFVSLVSFLLNIVKVLILMSDTKDDKSKDKYDKKASPKKTKKKKLGI